MSFKIVVLGSHGMLGQMVTKFFSEKYDVIEINNRYSFESRSSFLDNITSHGPCFIFNCIGKIKQKSNDLHDLIWVNSILPLDISQALKEKQILIHPSTDCIFNGKKEKGMYSTIEKPDAEDAYGFSKYLGEKSLEYKKNTIILRVSIIGIDRYSITPKGLLGWFLAQPSKSRINGFTNHFWNGITTLEWCKQVEKLIISKDYKKYLGGGLQLGTMQILTKYDMLLIFQKYFDTDFIISPYATKSNINRCLYPMIVSQNLDLQIKELKKYII